MSETAEPVRRIRGDEDKEVLEGIAICLSGGGYRAMLFHAGVLWRLSELGILQDAKRISSVSGGSIAAGRLALAWPVEPAQFEERVVTPLRELADRTIDVRAGVLGFLGPGSPGERAARIYDSRLYKGKTLQDLPDTPRFIFNATNQATGVLWRFSKPYMGDYQVGLIERPTLPLATAVAASAGFPPPLSPLRLELPATGWNLEKVTLGDDYRKEAVLCDGGVYDNLGIETAWKRYRTVFVSDAGGLLDKDPKPSQNMLVQMPRILKVIDGQVRALRRQQVVVSLKNGTRSGAYWHMGRPIAPAPGALPVPDDAAEDLGKLPTRLERMPAARQERLVNWGYACADAAVRAYYPPAKQLARPAGFPYPGAGVGPPA